MRGDGEEREGGVEDEGLADCSAPGETGGEEGCRQYTRRLDVGRGRTGEEGVRLSETSEANPSVNAFAPSATTLSAFPAIGAAMATATHVAT